MERDDIFWTANISDDFLEHTTVGEALEDHLGNLGLDDTTEAGWLAVGNIALHEFARVETPPPSIDNELELLAEKVWETLDEELGSPDNDPTCPIITDEARKLWGGLVAELTKPYVPWACGPTGNIVVVNALEWVRANNREWITGV